MNLPDDLDPRLLYLEDEFFALESLVLANEVRESIRYYGQLLVNLAERLQVTTIERGEDLAHSDSKTVID